MKTNIFQTFFFMTALSFLPSCADDVPEPLDRAIQAAEQMTSASMLERSAFYAIYPQGTPQQFVSFLFSTIGAAERPPIEGSGEISPDEEESMRNIYLPVWPAGVSMTHSTPKADLGMQVVWKWDNGQRKLILEGYADPKQPPVIVRETDLPIVQPSPMARMAAESALEMGGSAQAFQ